MTNNLDVFLDNAFLFYNQGDFERAESLARDVLNANPSHGDAMFLLGLIAYQAGAYEPAEELLFQAVKLYPDIPNYTLTLASILQKQNRLDEALTYYAKFSEDPMGITQSGFIYLAKKEEKTACTFFEKALLLCPDLNEARLGISLLNKNEDEIKKLAQNTNIPDAWYYLSKIHLDKMEYEYALTAVEKTGLKQDDYIILKGIILERLKQTDDAEKLYQDFLKRNPYRVEVWCNLGNIYRQRGENRAAEEYYKRALAQNKNDIATRQNLAGLLVSENRLVEALEQYRFILNSEPENKEILYNLAVVLEKTGALEDALGIYFKILFQYDSHLSNIEWRIADSISALAERDKQGYRLACDFSKGWIKNCPSCPVAKHTYATMNGQKETDISEYVKKLYDDFSDSYNEKMHKLEAKVLDEIAGILPKENFSSVLDLGCGTGLLAEKIIGCFHSIIGVDISEKMLKQAEKTGIYQDLICQDVNLFLKKHKKKYQLIFAIELLEYLTEITDFFTDVFNCLSKKGYFVFSVETTDEPETVLSLNGRYLYSVTYIQKILSEIGFKIITKKMINLRREGQGYAKGMIILAEKP